MLIPVPGLTHLKVLAPTPPFIDDTVATPPPASPARQGSGNALPLVRVALEVAFGMRPLQQLTKQRFDAGVRVHIAARRRATRSPASRGAVRVDTLHLREDGEIFGTAVAGGQAHAFTARVADNRLTSFRVL